MTTTGVCTVNGVADDRRSGCRPGFDLGGRHRQCDGHLNKDNGPPAVGPGRPLREGRARCTEAPVGHGRGRSGSGRVTVDGRAARLPGLRGGARAVGVGPAASGAWGRLAAAAAGAVRGVPGHACVVAGHGAAAAGGRRRGDRRRADGTGGRPWSPPDRGAGWACRRRRSAAGCGGGAPGWRRSRVHFTVVARLAGVDQAVPKALGSPWRDVLAAVGAATAAVTARFGTAGVIGPVTAWQVAAASSRVVGFSHPGWPLGSVGAGGNTSSPLTQRLVGPGSSRGSLPGNTCRVILPTTK